MLPRRNDLRKNLIRAEIGHFNKVLSTKHTHTHTHTRKPLYLSTGKTAAPAIRKSHLEVALIQYLCVLFAPLLYLLT